MPIPHEEPKVTFSYDDMEAYLYLPVPTEMSLPYTKEELLAFLDRKGVKRGIMEDVIVEMIAQRNYLKNVLVAKGEPRVDGIDGYYDYNFQQDFNKEPTIKPDGTVDYWSMNTIETVVENQVIAVYHPPIQGKDGCTVKGVVSVSKKGRELPPLKGKGFSRDEVNMTYISNLNGKIEVKGERINILPIYEIFGNAGLESGNIDFFGDVVIHGNVSSGATVKATGNITVDGIVEGATIRAGKNIILRSGMIGEQRGQIYAKGNLYAKFVEYSKVEIEGSIDAEVFLDCQVECGKRIILEGRKGSVIGGRVQAVEGVEARQLGNRLGVRTEVCVGADADVYRRMKLLEKKLEAEQANLKKIEKGLEDFNRLEIERGVSYQKDPRKLGLLREKIKGVAMVDSDRKELEQLSDSVDRSKGSFINVLGTTYPGVEIHMDDMKVSVFEEQVSVGFRKNIEHIVMVSLNDV